MAQDIIRIESISQLHQALGLPKPQHPLISVIDVAALQGKNKPVGVRYTNDFYMISKKDGGCGMLYGRNYYDFEEGVLLFTAPNQVITSTGNTVQSTGWMLFFHPDLLRGSNLGQSMSRYTFFSYDVHEALHMSEKEEQILDDIIQKIEYEYHQNIDSHSQSLFVSSIELLLNYSMRFYERQFHTRARHNEDMVTKVESSLQTYYTQGLQLKSGTPSVGYIADQVNLSPNYLSDLLKKETGRNAKEHINHFVVEQAKTLLLTRSDNVSSIAYDLGFNYPHYFSRMFKQQTGMTPQQYRETDLN
ncbi:MAG: helix-turn-helix transcriptional regulator [Bacteroidota bacterium]